MAPPAYHPESQSITVGMFYGGEFRNLPVAKFIGGKVAQCINKRSKRKDKRKVTVEDSFEFLGEENVVENDVADVGDVGNVGEDDDSDDEFLEDEYDMHNESGEDDDALFEKFVDECSANMGSDMESETESNSDSIDVVGSEQDLDEHRLSDDEGDGPSFPVFNPVQMYDPSLELEELRSTNPESTIILGINDGNGENRFEKFYVCFSAMKQGFLGGCRPIIGVDGCHLKGPHGGVLLTAVGVDPNNNLYPIAYAVVQRENRETWEWFLTVLKQDLNIRRDEEYTFMSDKQKGLIQAFHVVFPNSAHRFCVRHLHNNFKNARFRGLAFKNALWKAARSSTEGEFKMRMEEMRQLDQSAFEWFNDKLPQEWSKSGFNEHPKCDILLNNVCESFNANIMDARDKPILTMLEWIKEYLMKRLQENRDRATRKWKGILCPKIKKLVQKHVDKIGDCIPIKSNDRHYQISCYDGSQFSVDLEQRTCTCRIWQLSGIPLEKYLWSQTLFIPPLPPNFGRGPGRPAGARNREPDEPCVKTNKRRGKKQVKSVKLKRQHTTYHCRICGDEGHNAKGCALWKDMQEPGLEEIPVDGISTHQTVTQSKVGKKGGSSTSNSKKRKHCVYVDPNRVNLPVSASEVNVHPNILPPVTSPEGTNQADVAPQH
ncbi:UNVERIFIED_CONTAM: hypothetical protein Slati_2955100 [Sesamum latifolium]|uniref:CCHC-type domain-containing protein n=1 Tax=Sesamum latifolium TaxID=2727402 RepID=A0AAW2VF93_9LAMI